MPRSSGVPTLLPQGGCRIDAVIVPPRSLGLVARLLQRELDRLVLGLLGCQHLLQGLACRVTPAGCTTSSPPVATAWSTRRALASDPTTRPDPPGRRARRNVGHGRGYRCRPRCACGHSAHSAAPTAQGGSRLTAPPGASSGRPDWPPTRVDSGETPPAARARMMPITTMRHCSRGC